jgi:uncharacterized protein
MTISGGDIIEKTVSPNSIAEVATAVPAFVGYTQKAEYKNGTLFNKPFRIASLAEFHVHYGFGPVAANVVRFSLVSAATPAPIPTSTFTLSSMPATADVPLQAVKALYARDAVPLVIDGQRYALAQTSGFYFLHSCLVQFFQNGGGPCYIVSVGSYDAAPGRQIDKDKLIGGIHVLERQQEPTLLVVPEAVLLSASDCAAAQNAALRHCGEVMKNRFAILDVREGYLARADTTDCVTEFRQSLENNSLNFGAAYYPWLNTTVVPNADLTFSAFEPASRLVLMQGVEDALAKLNLPAEERTAIAAAIEQVKQLAPEKIDKATATVTATTSTLTNMFVALCPMVKSVMAEMQQRLNLLPPSAAMAGIYTMVDNARGVWKAPANVSVNGVVSASVPISHEQQEDLNVTPQGKSINAIRGFIGEGTLVWGARTLDGNSLDWRYLNVRRTVIMLEESIRLAAGAMVFEPNTADTWVTLKSMIENFLTGVWKRGGLAGQVAEDAFSVQVGLGETMTPDDITEEILRVTMLIAISRPAEFIEITFQQQMQKR